MRIEQIVGIGFFTFVVFFVVLANFYLIDWSEVFSTEEEKLIPGARYFTKEELKQYNGKDENLPVYLAVRGKVFDVSAGRKHYGPGGTYSFLSGKDASRAFATGCYEDTCEQGLHGLTERQLKEVDHWDKFYSEHKEYTFVGYLKGFK